MVGDVTICRHKLFFPNLARKSIYLLSPSMWIQAANQIYRSRGPAIVHFSVFRGLVPLYAMLLKLLFRNRVTLVHSAFGSLHYKRAVHRGLYDAVFLKLFVRLVDLRLAQNDHERGAYQRICRIKDASGQTKVVLFPLHVEGFPLDPTRFTESGKNRTAVRGVRRAFGIPEDAVVCLFLGRLNPAKGILRMIDAYLEFSRSCPRETLLLIVGHDDGFQSQTQQYILDKGIQNRVRIINNVFETRFDYYFLADLFLGFPTIFEETMLASLEAMACGTPVIVSKEADVPFVDDEQAGHIIDFDPATAAKAMTDVINNLQAFQISARRVASSHFDGTAASRNLRALICKAISGSVSSDALAEAFGQHGAEKSCSVGALGSVRGVMADPDSEPRKPFVYVEIKSYVRRKK
jgi:glycosyltransferase involved in cell wall biosynthesis